jgi:hypothetical protein
MAYFKQIDRWLVDVARLICDVSTSCVHSHRGYKLVLHSHHEIHNNMLLWEGCIKDENNLKFTWDFNLGKTFQIQVSGSWTMSFIGGIDSLPYASC